MTIYSLEVYILLFHVFLQMNTYVDNFCEVKKVTCIKGPVDLIYKHYFTRKFSKLQGMSDYNFGSCSV